MSHIKYYCGRIKIRYSITQSTIRWVLNKIISLTNLGRGGYGHAFRHAVASEQQGVGR